MQGGEAEQIRDITFRSIIFSETVKFLSKKSEEIELLSADFRRRGPGPSFLAE